MSCEFAFYVGNTNVVRLSGLKRADAGPYINDASVEVTVKDMAGNPVTGQTWPAGMPYVAGTDGNYEGVLSASLAIVAGRTYTAFVNANVPPGLAVGHWEYRFIPHARTQ